MNRIVVEVVVVLSLVLANGMFAASEMAVVSSRKARLRRQAEAGDRGAAAALELAEDPNRFLSTVQIGITLVGTLAGVVGGATLGGNLAAWLRQSRPLGPYAEMLGLGLVVVGITFFSLVLGELVPKRLALGRPERLAALAARPLRALSRAAVPAVRVLGGATEAVLWLLGARGIQAPPVTDEEVTGLMREGARAGVFFEAEQEMVRRVLRLGDRQARALMTPRSEVVWIDVADPPEEVRRKVTFSPHSQFPVCEGSLDRVVGLLRAKDLLTQGLSGRPPDLRGLLRMPLLVYEGALVLDVLETFRRTGTHVALALDEYGMVEGLITTNDVLEALVGCLPTAGADRAEPRAIQRADGSWLLDGSLAIDELREHVPLEEVPRGSYQTLAGLVLQVLGRIPEESDHFDHGGFRFEVVDMDGRRVDKVLITPLHRREPG